MDIRVIALIQCIAGDLIRAGLSAYSVGLGERSINAISAVIKASELVVTIAIGHRSIDDIPILGGHVPLEQRHICADNSVALWVYDIAADRVVMAFYRGRLILDTGCAYSQLDFGCLIDLNGLLTALTVADRGLKIVLAASKLQDCNAVSIGCGLARACAGVGHGRALYRCAGRINNRDPHLIGQADSQHDIGDVGVVDMYGRIAVGLIRIAVRRFVNSRQIECTVRNIYTEAAIVAGRSFDRLGLVIAVYDGDECICETIPVIVHDNTGNHMLAARIRFRTAVGLEREILRGIGLYVNRDRLAGVAGCRCIQLIASGLGCC